MNEITENSRAPGDNTPIGIYVITGFLGSGKTTLLNHLVSDPAMADTAVIINEFGEVGIDHALVEKAFEDALLLSNGCLCCTIRGDLLDTLETLSVRRDMGRIPAFKRVVIETTGLADPAPIVESLSDDMVAARGFALRAIATTVDAVHGMGQLDSQFESVKQAGMADLLLVTKTDLADAGALTRRLRALNPGADIETVLDGRLEPERLFALDGFDAKAAKDWLGADHSGDGEHEHDHHHSPDVNAHNNVRAISIIRDTPLPWPAVRAWLRSLASLRGADILRMKGILCIEDVGVPIAVHGIQSMLHPPKRLKGWNGETPGSRVVFIGRDLDAGGVNHALDTALAEHANRHS
ncbi:MAG: GTP-binding protein [Rhodospirillaceae bacterium]|jgi:G3E family GTPase|nr:GTP-binding protein [Rhodospirillaceae bacterium]MBT3886220.1 GTP-binding protein [Rhodospirillaceae bacterium]MBT4673804.1 GTP-binding protein [Rhodospirillaceae bacterium]MBT4719901.1 GTP-binding protein [Rhodospirillaceae bacterium]MBT4749077.1 GTP-binding protein [Rhodospirillaceae bacterium]